MKRYWSKKGTSNKFLWKVFLAGVSFLSFPRKRDHYRSLINSDKDAVASHSVLFWEKLWALLWLSGLSEVSLLVVLCERDFVKLIPYIGFWKWSTYIPFTKLYILSWAFSCQWSPMVFVREDIFRDVEGYLFHISHWLLTGRAVRNKVIGRTTNTYLFVLMNRTHKCIKWVAYP